MWIITINCNCIIPGWNVVIRVQRRYTVMLQNYMPRFTSIEVIGLHNMFMGSSDSVCFCYDDSKTDKIRKKVSYHFYYWLILCWTSNFYYYLIISTDESKKFYANSQNYMIYVFISLGSWSSIIRDQFQNKGLIFMRAGTHYSGAKIYAAQLIEMLKP